MAIEEDPPPGVPEWIVTFGDMMSLLLTFFIMLVSLSEVKEEEKYQALVESVRRQFGHDMSNDAMVPGRTKPRNAVMASLATMGRARKYDLVSGGNKESAPTGDDPRVRIIRPGERTAIGTVIFFPDDSAELIVQHKQDLQRLALEITGKPQIIEIRGHTNLRPAEDFTSYKDNWELAYARSRATMQFLVQELGIDGKRVRISVAAANEPLHIGTDLEKLRRNSRVEIFLTDEVVEDRKGTQEERQGNFTQGPGT